MRKISFETIINTVKELCLEANYHLGYDVLQALQKAEENEQSPTGKEILNQLIENARIAATENLPLCQDTGFTVVFLEIGQDVQLSGGDLYQAIDEGVRQAYQEGYLRKSIVRDPLDRVNTGDNTPAVIHVEIVPGNKIKISVAPKGGGSENMSRAKVLTPAAGLRGIEEFVIDCVTRAGGNPCPPIIIGLGLGGTLEQCTLLAKKSLLRTIGSRHPKSSYADLEQKLLTKINQLGIGPLGLGGTVTALAVFIETYPCHIASLPVAVNIQCHSARHKEAII